MLKDIDSLKVPNDKCTGTHLQNFFICVSKELKPKQNYFRLSDFSMKLETETVYVYFWYFI